MRTRQLILAMTALLTLIVATGAHAQIRLPVSAPNLPLPSVPQALAQADTLPLNRLSDLRRADMQRLVQRNRRLIDTDPNGEPIVRSEILALSLSDDAAGRAEARGFIIDRDRTIGTADLRLTVLKVPPGWTTERALRELRAADPEGRYDYNHIYSSSGVASTAALPSAPDARAERSAERSPRMRIGLLDTGIDSTHPVFHESLVHIWGCGGTRLPKAHGTAVASLLVAPAGAELYAADVYCGLPTGGSVDAIVAAFGWLMHEQVPVINVSLVGPGNIVLEQAVRALIARGYVLVAAVGNDGPAAPPLYPAAYVDVVGVTAVDAQHRVLIEAERGPQVMFAALGADITAATTDHGSAAVRGTSFAAPKVAALLAAAMPRPDKEAARAAIDSLAENAIDLGPPGRDLTYGFGLVGVAK